jgi:hypothetical protein
MLQLGELHVKHAVQHRILMPPQHFLWDEGNRKPDQVGWLQDFPDVN